MDSQNQSHVRINEGTATRSRGRARVSSIISNAREIFLNEGYENLKLKSVADAEGISLGNLTYYFKTKEDLFKTLIEDILNQYKVKSDRFALEYPDEPEARFKAHLGFLLVDCKKQDTQAFFYQLWSISIHNEFISDCRKKLYEEFLNESMELCKGINPSLNEDQAKQKAFLICALLEGLHVMYGNQTGTPKYLKDFDDVFIEQAKVLVMR